MNRGRKPIQDQFTKRPVSRQRKWQLRKQAQRKCIICGTKAVTRTYCSFHRKANLTRRALNYLAVKATP